METWDTYPILKFHVSFRKRKLHGGGSFWCILLRKYLSCSFIVFISFWERDKFSLETWPLVGAMKIWQGKSGKVMRQECRSYKTCCFLNSEICYNKGHSVLCRTRAICKRNCLRTHSFAKNWPQKLRAQNRAVYTFVIHSLL